jgi:hypothetical protein
MKAGTGFCKGHFYRFWNRGVQVAIHRRIDTEKIAHTIVYVRKHWMIAPWADHELHPRSERDLFSFSPPIIPENSLRGFVLMLSDFLRINHSLAIMALNQHMISF